MPSHQLKLGLRMVIVFATAVVLALVAPHGAAGPSVRDGPEWVWPLEPAPPVARPFDPPPGPYAAGHRGVDLVSAPGAVVLAAADGVVVFAGRVVDRDVVSVAHAGGLRSTYEPVTPSVGVGARVRAGDPIGVLVAGHRGCPAPACLHWGLRREGTYLDPLLALRPLRVRLLPL